MKPKIKKGSSAKSTKGKNVPRVRLMRGRVVMTKTKGG